MILSDIIVTTGMKYMKFVVLLSPISVRLAPYQIPNTSTIHLNILD